jgi:hypothetical protein
MGGFSHSGDRQRMNNGVKVEPVLCVTHVSKSVSAQHAILLEHTVVVM